MKNHAAQPIKTRINNRFDGTCSTVSLLTHSPAQEFLADELSNARYPINLDDKLFQNNFNFDAGVLLNTEVL